MASFSTALLFYFQSAVCFVTSTGKVLAFDKMDINVITCLGYWLLWLEKDFRPRLHLVRLQSRTIFSLSLWSVIFGVTLIWLYILWTKVVPKQRCHLFNDFKSHWFKQVPLNIMGCDFSCDWCPKSHNKCELRLADIFQKFWSQYVVEDGSHVCTFPLVVDGGHFSTVFSDYHICISYRTSETFLSLSLFFFVLID